MAGIFDPRIFQNEGGAVHQKLFQVDLAVAVVSHEPSGVGGLAWRDHFRLRRLPKKQRLLLKQLDAILLEIRALIDEAPEEIIEPWQLTALKDLEAFYEMAAKTELSLAAINEQLDLAKRVLALVNNAIETREIEDLDDEDALILSTIH